jgi:hypothetical protein
MFVLPLEGGRCPASKSHVLVYSSCGNPSIPWYSLYRWCMSTWIAASLVFLATLGFMHVYAPKCTCSWERGWMGMIMITTHWILGYSMFRQTHMFIIHHHMIQPGRPCDCCLCQWNYLLKVCKGHLPLLKHVKTVCSCSHHELSNWKLLPSIRSFDAGRPCVPSLTMRRSYFFARDYVFVSDVFPAGLMLKGVHMQHVNVPPDQRRTRGKA